MSSELIGNDTKLHSIDSIGFLKVLQQQAIIAFYHILFAITSFCSNGNVTTDIFLHQESENLVIWFATQIEKYCTLSHAE